LGPAADRLLTLLPVGDLVGFRTLSRPCPGFRGPTASPRACGCQGQASGATGWTYLPCQRGVVPVRTASVRASRLKTDRNPSCGRCTTPSSPAETGLLLCPRRREPLLGEVLRFRVRDGPVQPGRVLVQVKVRQLPTLADDFRLMVGYMLIASCPFRCRCHGPGCYQHRRPTSLPGHATGPKGSLLLVNGPDLYRPTLLPLLPLPVCGDSLPKHFGGAKDQH